MRLQPSTRRQFTRALGASLAAAAAGTGSGGFASQARAADLVPFKLGLSAPSVSILPVYFAEAADTFRAHGVNVEVVSAEGGTRGIQVLMSGEFQAMHVGLAPVVQANLQGADLRLVAASINTLPYTIYGARKGADTLVKGSRIGISTFGSETDVAVTIALKSLGLSRDDVEITQIGGLSQRYAAMLAGRIDAAPLVEPAITMANDKGLPVILDLAARHTPWIFDAVVVTRAYAHDHRDDLLRFLRGYIEGAMRGLGDANFGREVIAKRFKTTDQRAVEATYADYQRMMARDVAPSLEGARNVLVQLKALGMETGSAKAEDHLDLTLLDDLAREGFGKKMAERYGIR
jgi:NitT/TauT family transport system substrate-binding protein